MIQGQLLRSRSEQILNVLFYNAYVYGVFRPTALQLTFPLSPGYESDYPTGSVGSKVWVRWIQPARSGEVNTGLEKVSIRIRGRSATPLPHDQTCGWSSGGADPASGRSR